MRNMGCDACRELQKIIPVLSSHEIQSSVAYKSTLASSCYRKSFGLFIVIWPLISTSTTTHSHRWSSFMPFAPYIKKTLNYLGNLSKMVKFALSACLTKILVSMVTTNIHEASEENVHNILISNKRSEPIIISKSISAKDEFPWH